MKATVKLQSENQYFQMFSRSEPHLGPGVIVKNLLEQDRTEQSTTQRNGILEMRYSLWVQVLLNKAGWSSEWLGPLRDKASVGAWDDHTGLGMGIVASIKTLVLRLYLPPDLRSFIPSLPESPMVPAMAWRSSWEVHCSYVWFHRGGSFAVFIFTVKFNARYRVFGWKRQYRVTAEWSSGTCNRWYFVLNEWVLCDFVLHTHTCYVHPPKILDVKRAPQEGNWWKKWRVWKGFTWRKITLKSFFIHTCPSCPKLSWIPKSCNTDITKDRVLGKVDT